jgi:hypothetical protein
VQNVLHAWLSTLCQPFHSSPHSLFMCLPACAELIKHAKCCSVILFTDSTIISLSSVSVCLPTYAELAPCLRCAAVSQQHVRPLQALRRLQATLRVAAEVCIRGEEKGGGRIRAGFYRRLQACAYFQSAASLCVGFHFHQFGM